MTRTATALGWFAFVTVSVLQPAAANGAMICNFNAGVVKTYENGVFKDEKLEALSFRIEDVDLVRQTAALRTKQGKGELKIVRAIGANHFLEVVTEGFLNMTTIYDAEKPGMPMPAVHSRHFGFFGAPFVSQYHGICQAN
ncbi:MAG: hypothetical protein ACR2PI_25895 [Hyphomicrobiaceae bacterium]